MSFFVESSTMCEMSLGELTTMDYTWLMGFLQVCRLCKFGVDNINLLGLAYFR